MHPVSPMELAIRAALVAASLLGIAQPLQAQATIRHPTDANMSARDTDVIV